MRGSAGRAPPPLAPLHLRIRPQLASSSSDSRASRSGLQMYGADVWRNRRCKQEEKIKEMLRCLHLHPSSSCALVCQVIFYQCLQGVQ